MSRPYQANLKLVPLGPWATGLVNNGEVEQVPPTGLLRAKNVDIDKTGVITSRRPLYKLAGTPTDIGNCAAVGGTLIDQTTGAMYEPVGRYTILNNALIHATGEISGLPSFTSPSNVVTDDERMLIALPGGFWAEAWRGRLLVLRDNLLIYSEPLNYSACDPVRNYVVFPHQMSWIAPLNEGLYVATESSVYFLTGTSPEKWVLTQVYGSSWVGAGATISTTYFGEDALRSASNVAVWFGTNGFVFGLPTGQVLEPQAANLTGLPLSKGRIWQFEDRLAAIPMTT